MTEPIELLASSHLHELCSVHPDRRPGSPGNDVATGYVAAELQRSGWQVSEQTFDTLDWSGTPGTVRVGREQWAVHPSPYARGAETGGPLVVARTPDDLLADLSGRVVLLLGDLASEPLTPLDYPFYDNPEHAALVRRLIDARPRVVLAGTGRAPALAGSVEPFPLIEDGAFPVPTANLRVEDAQALARHAGERVRVDVTAHRWPSHARNVVARLGTAERRVVLTAHVDTKPGTPGALDNAAGVVTLLLLARDLPGRLDGEVRERLGVEIAVLNGEDSYAAPGERAYLAEYADTLDAVVLAANIDAAGYRVGATAYSLYGVGEALGATVHEALAAHPRVVEGPPWHSSDHMVFAQRGVPALALTTDQLETVLSEVVHSTHDTPAQVDVTLLVAQAHALADVVEALAGVG